MPESSVLEGKKVLVVDDEPDILELVEEILAMCQVFTASTFEQGKALLGSMEFDVAILDIMGVDGYGLLEIANKKDIPAVILTAHAFTADNLVKTIKEGGYSYIPKEELSNIADYLIDAIISKQTGSNPWETWQKRLPSSYFEKRWGSTWKNMDREFWQQFKNSLRARNIEKK